MKASLEEIASKDVGEYVVETMVEVEFTYGAVLLNPELAAVNVVRRPQEPTVSADWVKGTEDVIDCQSMVVLIGNGRLVGCIVMMEVLISERLLIDVDQEPTELVSDPKVLEKL